MHKIHETVIKYKKIAENNQSCLDTSRKKQIWQIFGLAVTHHIVSFFLIKCIKKLDRLI